MPFRPPNEPTFLTYGAQPHHGVPTLKAAVFMGSGDIRVLDLDKPDFGPKDVLIRVSYCGICGSDVTAYKTGNYVEGMIIGHELSGVVEDVGDDVDHLVPGDRVVVNSAIPCGHCKYCLRGRPSQCENLELIGITREGGMAEYLSVPGWIVYRIPDNLSLIHATLVEPLSNVLHAFKISSFKVGDTALIQGAGPIGVLLLEVLKMAGASKIIVSEISEGRRKLAEELGADVVVNPLKENLPLIVERETGGEGVDIVFDAAGVPETLKSNFTLARKAGEIVIIGITEEPAEADFFTTVLNELTIRGSYLGFNEFQEAIRLVSEGRIHADEIITSIIELDEVVEKGFKKLVKPIKDCKIVVKLGGG